MIIFYQWTLIVDYLLELLKGTDFEEEITTICNIFDQQTKAGFGNAVQPQFIRFSSRSRDTNEALGIKGGQMKIEGCVLNSLYLQGACIEDLTI